MNTTSLTLLERARDAGDSVAWERLVLIYKPVLGSWLRQRGAPPQDADDLVQEVLAVVVQELPNFTHRQTGAFRGWLRAILGNRLRTYWRQGRCRPVSSADTWLLEMADASSDNTHALSQQWDREHDVLVLGRLLELMEQEFEPGTLQAFRRVVLDCCKTDDVAAELGISVAAVYIAKSRVMRRLRAEAAGLID